MRVWLIRGVTLLEVLMSITLFAAAIGLLLPLIHQAFVHGHTADQVSLAYSLAQSRVAAIRAKVQDPLNGLAYFQKDVLDEPATPDADHPDYIVSGHWTYQELFSPCTSLESGRAEERKLLRSSRKLEVAVQWGKANSQRIRLIALIGAPSLRCSTVELEPKLPVTLAADGTIDVKPRAFDAKGSEIPDLFFSWNVKAITGSGEIASASRDGRQAQFRNRSRSRRGEPIYTGGSCKIQCQVLSMQRETVGNSGEVTLEKPTGPTPTP